MGFKASTEVDTLDFDFNPYADVKGVIPEPSSKQIDTFRAALLSETKALGLTPEQVAGGGVTLDLDEVAALMEKSSTMAENMVDAVAALTGLDAQMLHNLPHRPKQAFVGYIVGEFFSPED